ncbi:MAG TPA: 2-oxo-4-hydroxy-4-carboxy-5-ureidoimidazoline decarboxylase [Casimicrobiaceae bacterium]|jgi:2-oxo-4-hydroxy-4-carboxy-5-ureidoimidazoline decarboxylase
MTTPGDRITLNELNRLDEAAFTRALGEIFEHSPWVAAGAWCERPFADIGALHRAMAGRVLAAPRERRLALLRSHPELAGREARDGALTARSTAEQSGAGLDALSRNEALRIAELNAEYRARFGFPFIIAVKNYTKRGILRELERRVAGDPKAEFDAGVRQVCEIGLIRLEEMLGGT